MADLKWDYELQDWQRSFPVVETQTVDLPKGVIYPNEKQLLQVFQRDGFKLQTWGRKKDDNGKTILTNDPHWIAVRKGTPLHNDPKYPRYSHHLKIRVDDGIIVRGLDLKELPLYRGTYYVLDAHSPHQVLHKNKMAVWNVAVSIDSHDVLPMKKTIDILIDYALNAPFIPD